MVHMDKFSVCMRWGLFAVNCMVWLGGSVMLGLGIWVTTQDTEYKHLAGNMYITIGYIVLSSFIFIIGLMGTCGIMFLKKTLLKWYFGLVLVLVLAEIGVALYLYLEKDKIQDHIHANWNETSDETRVIIQQKFECCSLKPVILSHDSSHDKSCFKDNDTKNERFTDCYTQLTDWMKRNHVILASCAVVVAVLEIFILGGTGRLITTIESGDRSVKRTRVVPLQDKENVPRQFMTDQESSPQKEAPRVQAKEDESLEESKWSTVRRQKWAKRDPKYDSVFSLLYQ